LSSTKVLFNHLLSQAGGRLAELAIVLLTALYAEAYSAIPAFAMEHGDSTSPKRDLLALGAANLSSGLSHGMPVGRCADLRRQQVGSVPRCARVVEAVKLKITRQRHWR
jgi:hypothetical protein